jgi:hypothetical protein
VARELGVCDSRADNCPEMVLTYCASSAEVNKFSLHRQTRKEERSPATAASHLGVVLRSFFFNGGLFVGGEPRREEEACSWSFINWNFVMNGCA